MKNKKIGEKEDFEIKSQFSGTEKEWLKLIKTIVAMANRSGGRIKYEKIDVKFCEFDSANLDNKVNSYVAPKIRGIKSVKREKGVLIEIPTSGLRPHIFIRRGIYKNEKGNEVAIFYEGQIWTRHSAKNELFDKSDFDLIIREELQKLLDRMKIIVAQSPERLFETSETGVPLKIKPVKNEKEGLPVLEKPIDPNIAYPYQTKDLAKLLEKPIPYIAQLLKVLQWKDDPKYNYNYKNSDGRIILRKYNDKCLEELRRFISENPTFNPWRVKYETLPNKEIS